MKNLPILALVLLISCTGQAPQTDPPLPASANPPVNKLQAWLPDLPADEADTIRSSEYALSFDTRTTLEELREFYLNRTKSSGFSLLSDADTVDGRLIQMRKGNETISVSITRIMYTKAHRVRLGFSQVNYDITE